MNLLLDAHTLIWAVDDPSKLGRLATDGLEDTGNDLLLSAGTIWEIAIKVGLKKLSLSHPFRQWMSQAVADIGLRVLPITVDVADAQIALPKMQVWAPFTPPGTLLARFVSISALTACWLGIRSSSAVQA